MTPTQELLHQHPDLELTFVQHRTTRTVHITTPHDPNPYAEHEPITTTDTHWIGWLIGDRPTLCGYTARIRFHPTTPSDHLITTFPDDLLCGRCHRALGPHSDRAFEHPLPRHEEP